MITLHIKDNEDIYTASVDLDPAGPMPSNSTTTAPPALTGAQVARWTGSGWEVLAERPPLPAPTAAEVAATRAAKWEAIKARRDSREAAGVQVGDFWFHTDADSRIKMLGLKDLARDALAAGGTTATVLQKLGQDIPWQTLSGVAAPMTVQLSFDVVAAVGDLDAVCHYVALQHNTAMMAAADPAAYDFSTGWPVAFGG